MTVAVDSAMRTCIGCLGVFSDLHRHGSRYSVILKGWACSPKCEWSALTRSSLGDTRQWFEHQARGYGYP